MEDEYVPDDFLLDINIGESPYDREPGRVIGPDDPWLSALRAVSLPMGCTPHPPYACIYRCGARHVAAIALKLDEFQLKHESIVHHSASCNSHNAVATHLLGNNMPLMHTWNQRCVCRTARMPGHAWHASTCLHCHGAPAVTDSIQVATFKPGAPRTIHQCVPCRHCQPTGPPPTSGRHTYFPTPVLRSCHHRPVCSRRFLPQMR